MEELQALDSYMIEVANFGKTLKLKNNDGETVAVATFHHHRKYGCCGIEESDARYTIRDINGVDLWKVEADIPESCCGSPKRVVGRVRDTAGALLGEYEGEGRNFTVQTSSGDHLYRLTRRAVKQEFEIVSASDPHVKGSLKKQTTIKVMGRLSLPPGVPPNHHFLLVSVSLELVSRYITDAAGQGGVY